MNDYAKAWVEGLESDEYTQGFGYLWSQTTGRGQNCYCVMGVGCEVTSKLKPELVHKGICSYNGNITTLPYIVQDLLGLTSQDGDFTLTDEIHELILTLNPNMSNIRKGFLNAFKTSKVSLIWLNDAGKLTLPQIAQVIRANPPGLFK